MPLAMKQNATVLWAGFSYVFLFTELQWKNETKGDLYEFSVNDSEVWGMVRQQDETWL